MTDLLLRTVFIVGRSGLASLFALGAANKIVNYGATLERMEAVGLSPALLLLPMVIVLELLGGVMIAFGIRYTHGAAMVLAVYTLATNAFFHRFWEVDEPMRALELSLFFKNISIAGGLLVVAAAYLFQKNQGVQKRCV